MAKFEPPKDLTELIDEIEAIREQLLSIQRSPEMMERKRPTEPSEQ
jgi:hypothetical protein